MANSLPKRRYPRADFIDYMDGSFFVTICTKNKAHYFGYILDGEMYLSPIGEFVKYNIESTRSHFPDAKVLNFVVMPNHLHLIISIEKDENKQLKDSVNRGKLNGLAESSVAAGRDPTMTTHHNSRLAVIVGSMKSAVTNFANRNNIEFGWQKRFYDHEIRSCQDGDKIWNYIDDNIANWENDGLYT